MKHAGGKIAERLSRERLGVSAYVERYEVVSGALIGESQGPFVLGSTALKACLAAEVERAWRHNRALGKHRRPLPPSFQDVRIVCRPEPRSD